MVKEAADVRFGCPVSVVRTIKNVWPEMAKIAGSTEDAFARADLATLRENNPYVFF